MYANSPIDLGDVFSGVLVTTAGVLIIADYFWVWQDSQH